MKITNICLHFRKWDAKNQKEGRRAKQHKEMRWTLKVKVSKEVLHLNEENNHNDT